MTFIHLHAHNEYSQLDFKRKSIPPTLLKKRKVLSDEHKRKIGESSKGRKASKETKEKISKALKGKVKSDEHKKNLWKNRNRTMSDAQKEKISKALKGRPNKFKGVKDRGTNIKASIALSGSGNGMFGKKHSEETRKKIGEKHKGKTISEETRKRMSIASKGRNIGRKHSEETKKKLRIACIGRVFSEECRRKISLANSGLGNAAWRGGIAQLPYCNIWGDKDFKNYIKERDGNKCKNPFCWKTSNKLCIHHIDYIKENCHPSNLITLCHSCNSRVNVNREKWTMFFNNLLNGRG